jgi:hypothetical protein
MKRSKLTEEQIAFPLKHADKICKPLIFEVSCFCFDVGLIRCDHGAMNHATHHVRSYRRQRPA